METDKLTRASRTPDVADGAIVVGGADVALASTSVSLRRRLQGNSTLAVLVAIVAFTLIGETQTNQFLKYNTWINILENGSFTAIVAIFMALVMISGGLDLSVGSTLVAGAVTAAVLVQRGDSVGVALLVALGVGAGIGVLNGFLINYIEITPIIATLGTLFGVRAIVTTWSGGLPVGPLPERFTVLGQKTIGTVPILLFYVVVIAVLAHVLLEYTTFGTTLRAVGANRGAARALGLNPRRVSTLVYILAGAFAALAGALQAAELGAADPTLGTGLELQVIAAVVIGGISIFGSIGTISGAVCGAVLLSVLTTGLVLLHFQGDLQNFVVGVVIVLAAGIDQLRKKRMFRTSLRRRRESA